MSERDIHEWARRICDRYRIHEMFQGPLHRRARPGDWIEIPLKRHDDGSIMTEDEMNEAEDATAPRTD